MHKNKHLWLTILLSATMLASALFTGCGQATNKDQIQSIRPENEGVDTPVKITEYTDCSSQLKDYFLKKGDNIAVISPSSTPTRKQTDAVMRGLKAWGYEPVEGKYACVKTRTREDCLADLTWALEDPDIKAIFCIRGGYAASEVMDQIIDDRNMDLIRKSGKLIIGYSDITIYHAAWKRAGVPSLHACMSATFSDLPKECVEVQKNLMQGKIPSYTCETHDYCKEGRAKGALIGGNLSTLIATLGTEYDPSILNEPYILFIEDVEEDIQHVHRCLTLLKHMGVLDQAKGIIFGEFTDIPTVSGDYDGDSRGGAYASMGDMITRQFTKDLDIPIAYGFPAGHGDVNYPLLMGQEVELKVGKDAFTIKWVNE